MDVAAAICGLRPAHRLHGAAHLECVLVERQLPTIERDSAFEHQPPEIAVGADVVESVIVDTLMGEMRRHVIAREATPEVQRLFVPGSVKLKDGFAVEEALRPLGPPARGVSAVDGVHGCCQIR